MAKSLLKEIACEYERLDVNVVCRSLNIALGTPGNKLETDRIKAWITHFEQSKSEGEDGRWVWVPMKVSELMHRIEQSW